VPKNLREALGEYQDYHYKLSVWQEIMNHLRTFISEGGVPPEHTIPTSFGAQDSVAEAVILGVVDEMANGPVAAIEDRLLELEEMQVTDGKERKNSKDTKKKSPAKKASGGVQGAGRRKPLRAVKK